MQLFVSYLSETKCIGVTSDSFETLLETIRSEFALENNFSLVSSCQTVSSLEGLTNDQNLFVNINVLGGGKKKGGKKRKAHTTEKKKKHKHQNVKLAVLNYYAVKDGKVEKIKKLCENQSCKHQGIFMANHWNRWYCGRCHLTLMKVNAPKEEPKKQKVVVKVEAKVETKAAAGKKGKK